MSTRDLIAQLRDLGVRLALAEGELKITAPKGVMTAELRDRLVAAKADIIELLSDAAAASKPVASVIEKADRSQPIPLSYPQQRMWFLDEFEEGSSVYNIPWIARLRGKINSVALEDAINDLIKRHELLRTTFVTIDGQPVQQIHDELNIAVEQIDMTGCSEATLQAALAKWSQEHFNLKSGPLLHARLIRQGDDNHVLLLVIHHIIADGWSLDILQRELVGFYTARCEGKQLSLPELQVQYADYAAWQRKRLSKGEQQRQLDYWTEKLRGVPPVLELPTDRPRPDVQSYRGGRLQRPLTPAITAGLKALARSHNATLFMVLLAAFDLLLGRYSGQDDLVVGTPIAGRKQSELEGLIGVFLNTLTLRADLSGNPAFSQLLERTRNTALDAFEHQDLPFEKLVDVLQPTRELSYTPIFQVLFMLQNAPQSEQALPGLHFEAVGLDYGTAKFDITLALAEVGDSLIAEIEYSTDLFDSASIESMLEHYAILLGNIVAHPETPIDALEMLSDTERGTLLVDWNATGTAYPADVTLQSLFEQQAAATPDATALTFGPQQLTYAELNRRANQLAHWLINQGVTTDELIGVHMERSIEMVVALLGIIKAGAAYVPLDPEYPEHRLEHMLEDANTRLLLSQSHVSGNLPAHNARVLQLDEAAAELAAMPADNPQQRALPNNLAYTIFTSGSTGRPKGVMNEHRGICNRLLWMQQEYGLTAADRVLQKTPFSFDVSVWEFFWPLISGATLVVAKPGGHKDPEYLAEIIDSAGITTLHFVPSMLQVFLQNPVSAACSTMRRVICSGEALSHELQTRFYRTFANAGLHNLYGPTEAAIDVTYWACPRESTLGIVPIGKPVANTSIYIVDKSGNPSPIGVPGELWIGGVQVARGYVGQPELTAQRFIPDPFSTQPGARVYRTGDLVRYRNDGNIEFLGRIDHQVKLRGFRIELGEIEANLDALEEVEQSLVLLREDTPGNKKLVAYLTAAPNTQADVPAIRQQLHAELPDYMVPAAFVVLPEFPLMPNGKVDRSILPAPAGTQEVDTEFVPPRNLVEQQLADIWADLLQAERVGIHDNFFDLGGDSILSIQIITRSAKLGLKLVPKQVFKHQTIAELAEVVGTVQQVSAEQGPVSGTANLIPVQRWFLDLQNTDQQHFNQSSLLEFAGNLDDALLAKVFHELLLHHDALRLRLEKTAAGWQQHIDALNTPDCLRSHELSKLTEAEQDAAMYAAAGKLQASLDPATGVVIAAAAFHLGDARNDRLLIVVHHLAIDGISWRILLEDLASAYEQAQAGDKIALGAKTSSVLDWARHLSDFANSAEVLAALDYWQNLSLPGDTTLPVDRSTGLNILSSVKTVNLRLDEHTTKQLLQDVPRAYRTQINDILLAALGKAVCNWTGNDTLFIDMEGHGRDERVSEVDISRTVGWFTSIYPVAVAIAGSGSTSELIKSVKEQLRQIPNNGSDYGLLRYLNADSGVRETMAAIPAPPILFNYLGQFDQSFDSDQLFNPTAGSTGPDVSPARERSHLIDINGSVFGGKLQMGFSFSENLHKQATIQKLADQFSRELLAIIKHCTETESVGYTPSDFPLATISQLQLDELLADNRDLEDIYPITPMEHAMLFQSMLSAEAGDQTDQLYLTQVVWTLEGRIDGTAFEQAWQHLIKRHETLRTSFHMAHLEVPLAVIHRDATLKIEQHDWRALTADERENRLRELLHLDQQRGYDLSSAPLMRVYLLRFGDTDSRFIWSHHHIIIDGWSIPLVLDDLFSAYNAITGQTRVELPSSAPYRDYVAWLLAQDRDEAEQFWRTTLKGFGAPTSLPAAKKAYRRLDGSAEYTKTYASLPADETLQLRQLAKHMRVTVNTLVQGIWALLVSRYTGEQDIVFGATSSGRPPDLKNVERIVGLFLNALPVRISVDPSESVQDWLSDIQEHQLAARQHEYASLVDIQNWSDVPRGTGLFDSLFIFENYPEASSLWSDRNTLKVRDMQADSWTNFPLSVAVSISHELVLRLSYDNEYFDAAGIATLTEHFLQLTRRIIGQPEARLVELLRPDEPANGKAADPTAIAPAGRIELPDDIVNGSLAAAFERQTALHPDAVAVEADETTLTYAELNDWANRIAARLIADGIPQGSHAGLILGQNAAMVAGLLGVLKAGLVYIPLDPDSPPERLHTIVSTAHVQVIVCDPAYITVAQQLAPEDSWISIATTDQLIDGSVANPDISIDPNSLAYILFTSGSTGTPKGVMQTHRNALHHIRNYSNAMQIATTDKLSLFAPYGFDAAVMDIYGALFNGACLCPINIKELSSTAAILSRLKELGITIYHSTPTVFRFLLADETTEKLANIRLVTLGGEETRVSDLRLFKQHFVPPAEFCNLMGATEYSLAMLNFANHETELDGITMPLGHAAHNSEICLLDSDGEPGLLDGELCIRSACTTPGYWQDSEATAKAFFETDELERRTYRTGDLCRYTPDGQIVFVKRIDGQIKVRGNRIETGEIEVALNSHESVDQSVVILRQDDQNEPQLVAYCASNPARNADSIELRKHLRNLLPEYMLPARIIVLDSLPRTPNGKINRRALPAPEWTTHTDGHIPTTQAEQELVAIWQELLKIEKVNIDDNFFDLGGHSLLTIKLTEMIYSSTGLRLAIADIFDKPTVRELSLSLNDATWQNSRIGRKPGIFTRIRNFFSS